MGAEVCPCASESASRFNRDTGGARSSDPIATHSPAGPQPLVSPRPRPWAVREVPLRRLCAVARIHQDEKVPCGEPLDVRPGACDRDAHRPRCPQLSRRAP